MTARTRQIVIVLACGAAALTLLIGLHSALRSRIASNAEQAALQPLLAVFPSAQRDAITLQPAGMLDDGDTLGLREPQAFYRARRDGQTVAWLLPALARNGYNGDISVITALAADGTVIGTQVLAQHESAGIGDRVERARSDWLDQFSGRSLANPRLGAWYVAKDGGRFDQITGATATSRAVTQAVRQTLLYFQRHRTELIAASHEDNAHE